MSIVLATGNAHKVREIRAIVKHLPLKIRTLDEFPGVPEVIEDGATLEENAIKKARTIAQYLKQWALADDTGLEVDSLGGEPGVFSARWAGPGCTYADNNTKLLTALAGMPACKRKAQFRCVIAIANPAGEVWTAAGSIRGSITEHVRGDKGFGYDPVFYVPSLRKTFSELPEETKNRVSHRARALKKAQKVLQKLLYSYSE